MESRDAGNRAVLNWWLHRKECKKQATRDAANLVALFSDGTYSEAVAQARHEGYTGQYSFSTRIEISQRTASHITHFYDTTVGRTPLLGLFLMHPITLRTGRCRVAVARPLAIHGGEP